MLYALHALHALHASWKHFNENVHKFETSNITYAMTIKKKTSRRLMCNNSKINLKYVHPLGNLIHPSSNAECFESKCDIFFSAQKMNPKMFSESEPCLSQGLSLSLDIKNVNQLLDRSE